MESMVAYKRHGSRASGNLRESIQIRKTYVNTTRIQKRKHTYRGIREFRIPNSSNDNFQKTNKQQPIQGVYLGTSAEFWFCFENSEHVDSRCLDSEDFIFCLVWFCSLFKITY